MRFIKPKRLFLGDTIGIIAPASPVLKAAKDKALSLFMEYGYKIKLGQSINAEYGYLAGADVLRAQDVNDMFSDPQVKAIFCLRGGYGVPRILEMIDYDLIRQHPKIFVGYSDITALHLAISKYAGLITFHGPMIAELAHEQDPLTWTTLIQHVVGFTMKTRYNELQTIKSYMITPGIAEGQLIGGNLSLICATLGTPYEIDTKDKILFLEDVGEEPYVIDRMLMQLRLAGKLQAAAGIVLTDFSSIPFKLKQKRLTLEQVFHDIIKPIGIPCYYGLKVGHCEPNLTMPIGVKTRLNATDCWIEFLEDGVRR